MKMFLSLRVRASQGTQVIADLRKATPTGLRGRPRIRRDPCAADCSACRDACPTQAIRLAPVTLDLGRCVFCNACAEGCPEAKIEFTPEPRMGGNEPFDLTVREGEEEIARVRASAAFSRLFGRSLKMRQVSAGGCNACELELNAVTNVNFDVQRFGIEWVASPRHADALVLTGPLTRNMKEAVQLAWDAMPEPRFIVAVGACAISGGLYDGAAGVDRGFLESVGPSLYVPGCPPHPLTFVNAILDLLGIA
ncbi:NADH:ubiquinone oxidoreductase [Sorangium sp. So ce1504]|uniref:NADH-quinone oxidoreductase subunit B family protein n=1 Tax=Sorangium sp. So ce1504 TaxID=3133337 RepID=UPI003F5EF2AE